MLGAQQTRQPGSDRGSPNHGRALLSKRVMAQILCCLLACWETIYRMAGCEHGSAKTVVDSSRSTRA